MEISKLKQLHRHIIEVSNELYKLQVELMNKPNNTVTESEAVSDIMSSMCSLCALGRYLSQYTLADERENKRCSDGTMDRIMEAGTDARTDDQSVRAQVLERVEMAGARGVYRNRLLRTFDRKIIDELCGGRYALADGSDGCDADAPLALMRDKNGQPVYILRRYKAQAIERGLRPGIYAV